MLLCQAGDDYALNTLTPILVRRLATGDLMYPILVGCNLTSVLLCAGVCGTAAAVPGKEQEGGGAWFTGPTDAGASAALSLRGPQETWLHYNRNVLLASVLNKSTRVQVFVALLRLCQADNKKALVRDALDTLTPVLVRRLAPGDLKYPIWVRYTKKVLVEEGHSTPHLIHIWQLLVRHADLYYSSR